MNNISASRLEIRKYFDPKQIVEDSQSKSVSPTGRYRIETIEYKQNKADVNWTVTKVSIYDEQSHDLAFEFFTDHDDFFHKWLIIGEMEYLVGSEILCGGQTVINLSVKKMESYCPSEDGFIWAAFFLSPNGNRLAVIGCYWACPYEVKIYDFSDLLSLPLPELKSVSLERSELTHVEWIDNHNFKTKCHDGSFRTHSVDTT